MPTPFEDAAEDAFEAHLEWWGEDVLVQPRLEGDYASGPDPSRAPVTTRAVVIRKDGVERIMGEAPGDKWGANVAVYPLTAYVPVSDFPDWQPVKGDRLYRQSPPEGEAPVLEVSRVGNRRGARCVLYCIEGPTT